MLEELKALLVEATKLLCGYDDFFNRGCVRYLPIWKIINDYNCTKVTAIYRAVYDLIII
jgi:hypothetical protein